LRVPGVKDIKTSGVGFINLHNPTTIGTGNPAASTAKPSGIDEPGECPGDGGWNRNILATRFHGAGFRNHGWGCGFRG